MSCVFVMAQEMLARWLMLPPCCPSVIQCTWFWLKPTRLGTQHSFLLIFLTGGEFSVLPTGKPVSQQNCWEWVSKCHIIKGQFFFFHNTQFTQKYKLYECLSILIIFLYDLLSSVEHKRRYFDVFNCTLKVDGVSNNFGPKYLSFYEQKQLQHSLKYLNLEI